MRSRFGWMLRLTSPRAHLNSFCAHERRIGETPTRNELAWKGNKRWLESIETYVYMRRQARATDEYIPCAISWPKNMVDGWSRQARTMCSLGSTSNHACLSTRVHKFVYKQDSPSTSIYFPHNGRPSLSVKPPYREECKCCGVDQGRGHAPTFRAHQSTWISEEGTLEVRSTLPCSFCRSPEEMPVDGQID